MRFNWFWFFVLDFYHRNSFCKKFRGFWWIGKCIWLNPNFSFPAALLSQWICLHCQSWCHPSPYNCLANPIAEISAFLLKCKSGVCVFHWCRISSSISDSTKVTLKIEKYHFYSGSSWRKYTQVCLLCTQKYVCVFVCECECECERDSVWGAWRSMGRCSQELRFLFLVCCCLRSSHNILLLRVVCVSSLLLNCKAIL